ncbi:TetR/AcrR family transcriptional regulator [uncultured Ruegeria sp.]|uniref:TetR/AcrR family transcriptional regulator n=1 Tax=uncultured Ruegeria sp. TaxID=259304 RepID=UPI00262119F6|nr:TetR/AcrR family transcriptional regulator [uncultured Ruegeria sp.]
MKNSDHTSPSKRTRDPEAKRAALHDAALQLFTEKGYENVSIAQVAKMSGIAVGTVYRFYDNKLAMLRAMLEEIEALFVDRMKQDWNQGGAHSERLGSICEGLFVVAEQHRSLLRLLTMTTDMVYSDGALPGDRIQNQIRSFYAEGISEGTFVKGDVAMMAAMAHGLVEGAMMQAMRSDNVERAEATVQLSTVMKNAFLAR